MAGNKVSRLGSSHKAKSERQKKQPLSLLPVPSVGIAGQGQAFLVSEPPLETLTDVSGSFLEGYELRRLNEHSNLEKELRSVLYQSVENLAQALLARWLRNYGSEMLARSTSRRSVRPVDVNKAKLEKLSVEHARLALDDPRTASMEPWFQTREVSQKILRLQSVPERRKWAEYYSRWGCIRCGKRTRPHFSNGMCGRCQAALGMRLREIVKTLVKGEL